MVKLFCAILGVGGSALEVDIAEDASVSALKKAIKGKKPNRIQCDADELQLFLAKKDNGKGSWLTQLDVLQGVKGTNGYTQLRFIDAKLRAIGLASHELGGVSEEEAAAGKGPVHVLVMLPGTILYWNLPPKPLLSTAGATWDFQNPLDTDQLSSAIRKHYRAWRKGSVDKKLHPLFTCLSGPGTGKSRLLNEFPKLLKDGLFPGKEENFEMIRLLQNAYTFNVTLENGTPHAPGLFSSSAEVIGTRMLYQLQDSLKWDSFVQEKSRHSVPSRVFEKLEKILDTRQEDMCVILCVDSMQKLVYENGNEDCEFYRVLTDLSGLVNDSKCWVIAICSATIYSPVTNFLVGSSQWRYQVPTAVLSRPTVKGENIFSTFGDD